MPNKATIYIDGQEHTAELIQMDTENFLNEVGLFRVLSEPWKDEELFIFINGDKFKEWL